jgi:hypothetical protein
VERSNDPELPTKSVFQRLGTKKKLATKVMEYCAGKTGYDDIIELCRSDFQKPSEEEKSDDSDVNVGEVYLFKSGRYYKIGRTSDTVRRGREIRIQLPERTTLVHSIKTDDPSGIEAYWHKRFEAKRMQGEWFNLSSADVRAFKCWRRIV